MRKLAVVATALAISTMIFSSGMATADDEPVYPPSQVTGDQGSSSEAESNVQVEPQAQEAPPQQDQGQDQPASDQAPSREEKE